MGCNAVGSDKSHSRVDVSSRAAGLSRDRTRWIACRPGFLLPVRVRSWLFRRRFLQYCSRRLMPGGCTSPARSSHSAIP